MIWSRQGFLKQDTKRTNYKRIVLYENLRTFVY